ncbi:MAG: hypothetical protein ACJ8CR_04360 [Roseiflexaceae bacterium]
MKRYLSAAVLAITLAVAIGVRGGPASAAAADIGYRDFQFGSSCTSTPTGEKPESKLWWNDGLWWGSLCAPDNTYHIFRLDLANQSWVDTGTRIDDRPSTKADTLWDGQKLYVASHVFTTSGAPTSSASQWGRLYRYSYDSGAKTYSLDSGFPVNVTRGKSETLVLERAKNEQLWVTYVESNKVMVNHSGGPGRAFDSSWGTPFVLGVAGAANLSSDDIASIITFDRPTASPKVGVLWSNQTDKKMYFATHIDGESDSSWSSFGIYVPSTGSPSAADDHINIKLQSDGVGVYAVTKTSNSTSSQPLIVLQSCKSGCADVGNWHATTIYVRGDNHTRAILLLDTSNRKINIFSTTPESGGNIYRKVSDMDNISFPNGHGDLFLKSTLDTKLNNPTSTKQTVNSTTGLVVLASDQNTRYYLHNYDALGGAPPASATPTNTPPPGATATPTNTPAATATPTNTPVASATATPTSSPTATPPTGGARIKDITFESGRLVDATNGVDSTSGSVTLETASPLKGSYSARVAGVADAYLQENFSATDDLYIALALRVNALPSADTRILLVSNNGTTIGNLVLRSNGALRLRNGTAPIGVDTAPLSVGATYRVGIHQKRGSGGNAMLEAYLAADGAAFGAPFAAISNGTWATAADRLRFGATVSVAIDATFDDLKLDAASMP